MKKKKLILSTIKPTIQRKIFKKPDLKKMKTVKYPKKTTTIEINRLI